MYILLLLSKNNTTENQVKHQITIMEKLAFKTNINCNACKSAVTPFLDKESRIAQWNVDLKSPDRILRVEGENINKEEIIDLITSAGYKIEELQ